MTRKTIDKILNAFIEKAENDPKIKKPFSWALYQAWRAVDLREVPRKTEQGAENETND